ncbi:MAG TPA: transglycosylase SLT domain-containing protein [Thermoanaerobaculia bacterium]|nr:transglycosylase SLT domain-containing protein [Thermoanaerobaculia bacterium]HUM30131.1 transglycosylase SLT domain-containing protein [Thermoanaerobaculia bacterium]HXK68828.1 transglycosylase SLT domain-containing protein [Thermoanaerobaculia bacterium]
MPERQPLLPNRTWILLILLLPPILSAGIAENSSSLSYCYSRLATGNTAEGTACLKRLASPMDTKNLYPRLALAAQQFRAGKSGEAQSTLAVLPELPSSNDPALSFAYLLRGRSLLESKDTAGARKAFARSFELGLPSSLHSLVMAEQIDVLREDKAWESVATLADAYLQSWPDSSQRYRIQWIKVQSQSELGAPDTAATEACTLWQADPGGPWGRKAASWLLSRKREESCIKDTLLALPRALERSGLIREAQRAMDTIHTGKLSPTLREEYDLLQARLLLERGEHYRAGVQARRLMKRLQPGTLMDEAAWIRFQGGRYRNQYELLEELGQWFDRSGTDRDRVSEVHYILSLEARARDQADRAIGHLKRIVDMGASVSRFQEAAWLLAWTYESAGRRDRALATFTTLRDALPESPYTVPILYWQGRWAEEAKDTPGARSLWEQVVQSSPFTYYGHLANRRLMASPARRSDDFRDTDEIRHAFDTLMKDEVVGVVVKAGLFEEAIVILEQQEKSDVQAFRISLLQAASGKPRQSLHTLYTRLSGTLKGVESPPFEAFWPLAYPRWYADEILETAGSFRLDHHLVFSLVRRESGFDPAAQSGVGALGLTQLMPSTARTLARSLRIPYPGRRGLLKPETNLKLGFSYLSQLIGRFPDNLHGRPYQALAAYNAGPGAVRRWQSASRGLDPEEWIEMIPYVETRLFVKEVLRSSWEYERLYGPVQKTELLP